MALFRCWVTEVRHYEVEYLVEADSKEEAREKAEAGATEREENESFECVWDRQVGFVIPEIVRGSVT